MRATPGGAPVRCDILDLYERGQRGEMESWDPFDLPMQSAVRTVRATGSITWTSTATG